ncbi:hypothetical protein [Myxococcus sp. AS-1-15]|uniref:hypothetical protein n=1 Tax=Myxococcus sp. AS-1-15 TaxID=2874600 RepID=UPI001CBFC9BA|nr:hypothetical protein [Myxococcus sp. AS-1-15]MBZ4402393.1 hypothetical protein [Myxococcus sp. AS-1-15]
MDEQSPSQEATTGTPVGDGAIIMGLAPGMHPVECTYTGEGDVAGDLTGTLNVGTGTDDDAHK